MSLHSQSQTRTTHSLSNINSLSSSVSSASTSSATGHGPYLEDIYPSYPQPKETLSSIYSNSSFGRGWSTGSLFANEESEEENKRERKTAAESLEKDINNRSSIDSGDRMSDEDQKRLNKVQRGENYMLEDWLKGLITSRIDGKLIDYSLDVDENPEANLSSIEKTYDSSNLVCSSNVSLGSSVPWSGSSSTSADSLDKQSGPKRKRLKNVSGNDKIGKKRSSSNSDIGERSMKNSKKDDFRDIAGDITEKHQKIQAKLLNLKHLMQDTSKSVLHLQLK